MGPGGRRLFDYSDEPLPEKDADTSTPKPEPKDKEEPSDDDDDEREGKNADQGPLTTPASKAAAAVDISTLEGYRDDPSFTKVVDRRWYERNKHIYPASTWQDFHPDKDLSNEIRRDTGGNTFFFS